MSNELTLLFHTKGLFTLSALTKSHIVKAHINRKNESDGIMSCLLSVSCYILSEGKVFGMYTHKFLAVFLSNQNSRKTMYLRTQTNQLFYVENSRFVNVINALVNTTSAAIDYIENLPPKTKKIL